MSNYYVPSSQPNLEVGKYYRFTERPDSNDPPNFHYRTGVGKLVGIRGTRATMQLRGEPEERTLNTWDYNLEEISNKNRRTLNLIRNYGKKYRETRVASKLAFPANTTSRVASFLTGEKNKTSEKQTANLAQHIGYLESTLQKTRRTRRVRRTRRS